MADYVIPARTTVGHVHHHHIGLNTWSSKDGSPPSPRHTGLYHLAILYPTRRDLAVAVKRVVDAGIPLQGATDHGVSEAVLDRLDLGALLALAGRS